MFLVAGASSKTGQLVVAGLLDRGHSVRILVRRPEDARESGDGRPGGGRLAAVLGDVRDAAAVERACQGVTTVISLVGRHFARTEAGLWDVDALGNETLIRAATAAGARRFVLLSALWSEREELKPVLFRAKRHAEQALLASGLRYAILRPSTFAVGPSSLVGFVGPPIERWGLSFVPGPDSGPISFIAETDVAEGLVRAAIDEQAPDRIVEMGGPERLTFAEGSRTVARVLGRSLRIVRFPRALISLGRRAALRSSFGAYEAMLFLEMMADLGYDCDPDGARALLGREPTTMDQALRSYYASTRLTPWSESNYGALRVRSR